MAEQSVEQKDALGRLALILSLFALLPLLWIVRIMVAGIYAGGEQAIALGLIWLGGVAATTLLAFVFRFLQPTNTSPLMRYALLIAWVPVAVFVAIAALSGAFRS